MKNRFLLLLLFMMTSVASWGYANGDIIYSVREDGKDMKFQVVDAAKLELRIMACPSLTGTVTIPSVVVDQYGTTFKVTRVGATVCNNATRVIISEGITHIEADAFSGTKASQIDFPSTLTSYADGRTMLWSSNLKKITMPENTGSFSVLGDTILLNKNGTHLQLRVRRDDVTCVAIPDGVVTMQNYAIVGSQNLKTVYFPKSFTEPNISSVYNNTYIENIAIDPEHPKYTSIDGIVYNKTVTELRTMAPAKSFTDNHFIIPNTVTTIKASSCYGAKFEKVTLPDNLELIESDAFGGCTQLKSIKLGAKVNFSGNVFYGCTSMTKFEVDEANPNFSVIDNVLFNKEKTTLVAFPGGLNIEYTVPDGVLTIGNGSFRDSKIKKVNFNDVKKIETWSFRHCASLQDLYIGPNVEEVTGFGWTTSSSFNNLIIGNKVKTIGNSCFNENTSLKTITFEEGSVLETLGENAFRDGNVVSMTIPATVKTIGSTALPKSLKSLYFENGSQLQALNSSALSNLTQLEGLDISGCTQLKTIGDGTFRNLTTLETISIPTSVTSIGTSAFNGCSNLKNVSFGENSSIKTIGANAFQDTGLESISLPDHLVSLKNEAFTRCEKLQTVNIPATTTSIGAQAFLFCTGLTSINVDPSNAKYATSDGMLCSKDKKTLLSFPAGKARDNFTLLSPSFEAIGDSAFYYSKNLKNITIPKHVTKIGKYAFYLCDNLNSITFLTDGPVNTLGEKAFGTVVNHTDGSQTTISPADFLHNNVTINIRKNGREGEYDAAESIWKDCRKAYSFKNSDDVNEYLPMSATTVNLLKSSSSHNSVVIPSTVTNAETSTTYSVGMISDYAFEDVNSNVKEIIFQGPVEYVGSCAFYNKTSGTSSIQNIFFVVNSVGTNELSTARFELGNEYDEFLSTQNIYVTRSKASDYKAHWPKFAAQITYEIPTSDIMPTAQNGSFAREFAVDLSNNGANNVNSPQFIAFVPMRLNSHYEDGEIVYTVRMQSINEGSEGDGTYIPAGTGVVLRKYGDNQPTYYEIAESQTNGNNAMSPAVICNSGQIPASTSTLWNYYIGKNDGLAHKVTRDTNIGVHKSYLSIPVAAGAKAVTFSFDELEDNTTGVSLTKHESTEDGEWYTVTGQKTKGPSAGLFIRNGKKFIVK